MSLHTSWISYNKFDIKNNHQEWTAEIFFGGVILNLFKNYWKGLFSFFWLFFFSINKARDQFHRNDFQFLVYKSWYSKLCLLILKIHHRLFVGLNYWGKIWNLEILFLYTLLIHLTGPYPNQFQLIFLKILNGFEILLWKK